MRKFKKLASKVVAFSMAALLTCSGFLDGLTVGSKTLTGNVSGKVNAEAATVSGTVNADKFSWDNATVYFMLTDRFRNGNTSNDHSYGRNLDANGNVINVSDDRATFHGGDFAGVTQSIKEGYFNDLGVNAIWISAPYEQIHGYIVGGDGSPSFAHYSYHGYYVLDYTQTDANFGTEAEFKEMVDTAHEHGIRIVLDIVLNHAGYNSLYDMNEYGFGVVKEGWDDYYFSMANVNNTDYHSYIDYDADEALWGKWWGPDWIRAGLPGYTKGEGDETIQSLAGLPDFKTESTKTVGIPTFLETKWKKEGRYDQEVNELKSYLNSKGLPMTVNNTICYWLSCWVREYGVDGFRCDTAKHVEKSEWRVLHDMCTEALKEWKSKNPDKKLDDLEFWMTGEHWDHGVGYDDYYSVSKFDSMINFDTTGGGVLALGTVASKYESYAAAINTRDDFNVLSYMSSHDTTLARGDMKYLGSALLMLPGGVQIFYGDELARPKVGPDDSYGAGHCLRSDMNWDNYDEDVLAHWQKVGAFRNNHIAVGAGTHTTVSATSGVGFVRTYSKNGVTDRIAAVIGASANAEVTIDVSGAWDDGSVVTNYYDNSSATVTGGKVTFNSGANGTILIADPDGKPLVTVTGTSKFKGTQTVKINIKEADYAIVSVDGAKKFKAYDGDTFTIGATAYEGDTVAVSYKATNEKGTINGKATFYKAYANEEFKEEEEEEEKVKGKVRVKMSDGSAPYLYAWESETKKFAGDWPGTKLTQKDSEGYYYLELDTTGTYNVIFNNGGAKTDDITGLSGETTFTVQAGFGSYEMIGGTVDKPSVDNTITIRVKPYSSSQQVYLHVWSGSSGITGAWPGKHLTEKDENGNYIFTVDGYESVNCIINNGSNQNQSDNITGITGEALITINSDSYGDYKVDKVEKAESKFALMKKEARGIKNMTSSDYTSATWQKLYAYVSSADALVAQGEENADADAVTRMYNDIVAAKKALVLAAPKVKVANSGSKVVKGMAACEATVSVTINGSKYTAVADEVTGVWTVNASSNLTSSSTISTSATREGLSSASGSYSLSGGNINESLEEDDDNNNDDDNNDDDDNKLNGWNKSNGVWYYYVNGVKQTSKWIDNKYYVKADGAMAVSEFVGNYYLDENGVWVTGSKWLNISGKYYYVKSGVVQKSRWVKVGSYYYYFDASGVMQANKWISNKYYVKSNGAMAVSEFVGNYYLDENGVWVTSTKWVKSNNKYYYLVKGVAQKSKWLKVGSYYYYFDASGVMQANKWINNKYYVKSSGAMAASEFVGNYYVDANGVWVTGTKWLKVNNEYYYIVKGTVQKSKWVKVGTKYYYFDASGIMQTNKWIGGVYYVKADGSMAVSEWVDNGRYYVDANGKWVKGA